MKESQRGKGRLMSKSYIRSILTTLIAFLRERRRQILVSRRAREKGEEREAEQKCEK